jgi:hypothetical protein
MSNPNEEADIKYARNLDRICTIVSVDNVCRGPVQLLHS